MLANKLLSMSAEDVVLIIVGCVDAHPMEEPCVVMGSSAQHADVIKALLVNAQGYVAPSNNFILYYLCKFLREDYMRKQYNDGFTCLPYERMTKLQQLLTDEGVSSLLGLQYKRISEKKIQDQTKVQSIPAQRKSFSEWAIAKDKSNRD